MKRLNKPIFLLFLVLLGLILPFLFFADSIEALWQSWLNPPPSRSSLALLTAAVLSSDILLPVPSSGVSTFAGAELGIWLATLASWTGMMIGALLGYALARVFGPGIARRFSSAEDLEKIEQMSRQHGAWMLALLRPIPVFAEASVLVFGAMGLPIRQFLFPVALSNLAIALVYSTFGAMAADEEWLSLAIGLSLVVPVVATFFLRKRLSGGGKQQG